MFSVLLKYLLLAIVVMQFKKNYLFKFKYVVYFVEIMISNFGSLDILFNIIVYTILQNVTVKKWFKQPSSCIRFQLIKWSNIVV